MSHPPLSQTQEATPNTPAYFAVLSAEVRYCKKIEMGAKLLYAELTALSNKEGYCWATNNYFAELYEVDVRTIKRWFASLQKYNFITIITEKKGCGWDRKVYIAQPNSKNVCEGTKMSPRGDKNVPSRGQKCPHNNTSNNKSITKQQQEELEDPDILPLSLPLLSALLIQRLTALGMKQHALKEIAQYPEEKIAEVLDKCEKEGKRAGYLIQALRGNWTQSDQEKANSALVTKWTKEFKYSNVQLFKHHVILPGGDKITLNKTTSDFIKEVNNSYSNNSELYKVKNESDV